MILKFCCSIYVNDLCGCASFVSVIYDCAICVNEICGSADCVNIVCVCL